MKSKPKSNPFIALAALATGFATLTSPAATSTFQWNGSTSSDWATDANWTGTAPDDADVSGDHRLNVNGATALIYSAAQGTSVFAADGERGVVIGSGANGSGTMTITGGSFSTLGSSGGDVIGNNANTAILTINGGAFIGTNSGTNLGIGGGPTSTLNVQSGSATLATLSLYATTATINLSGTGILAVNNISRSTGSGNGPGNINFDGGTLRARVPTATFLTGLTAATVNAGGVTVDSNSVNITIGQSLLGGAGSGGLLKTGDGTLTLTGTNTYTGPTTLSQGALSVGASANLGAAASNLVFDGGALQITGTTLTSVSGIGHTVSFNAGKLVALDINSSSNTFTVDQVLNQTTGGFTKLGAGRAVFTQANTYTGDTTITAGAIIRQVADTTTGNISVANNATFVLDGGITDGAGQSISINGPGATGADYFFTGSAVQRGALQAQNGANTWAGDIVINGTANTRIGVQDGASLSLTGNITESLAGSGILFRAGNANDDIILSGTGSWTGITTLFSNGGAIRINGNDRLSTAASVLFTSSGTTVLDLNGFNQELAGIRSDSTSTTIRSGVSGSSTLTSNTPVSTSFLNQGVIANGAGTVSFVKKGEGTQTLSNTNTYSGNTTVEAGTLGLTGGGSINSSALIDVRSTGTLSIAGVTTSTTVGGATAQTLQGTGTVNLGAKTMVIGSLGTLAPGASPGTLQFAATTGKLDFASGSQIAFELGTTSDLISFASAGDWLTGSGNATLALSLLGGFDYGNTYTIFENVTTGGFSFSGITGYDTVGYSANFAQNGTNYDLSFTVIPEPNAAALLGTLGTLILLRRRRAA
jgi:fibronectin-binding autotransporter adhesin